MFMQTGRLVHATITRSPHCSAFLMLFCYAVPPYFSRTLSVALCSYTSDSWCCLTIVTVHRTGGGTVRFVIRIRHPFALTAIPGPSHQLPPVLSISARGFGTSVPRRTFGGSVTSNRCDGLLGVRCNGVLPGFASQTIRILSTAICMDHCNPAAIVHSACPQELILFWYGPRSGL